MVGAVQTTFVTALPELVILAEIVDCSPPIIYTSKNQERARHNTDAYLTSTHPLVKPDEALTDAPEQEGGSPHSYLTMPTESHRQATHH